MVTPLVTLALLAAPKRLPDYPRLLEALKAGHQVRLVVDYRKTKSTIADKTEDGPDAVGGMPIQAWEEFGRGYTRDKVAYVAFSETVLISHPRIGTVYNYVGFRIREDGTATATARYLDPKTFEVKFEGTYAGRIDDGKNQGGFSFFSLNR